MTEEVGSKGFLKCKTDEEGWWWGGGGGVCNIGGSTSVTMRDCTTCSGCTGHGIVVTGRRVCTSSYTA